MKIKKITSIILFTLISGSTIAQEPTMKQQEDELKDILAIIEGKLENTYANDDLKQEPKEKTSKSGKKIVTIEEYTSQDEESKGINLKSVNGNIDSYDHVYLLNIPIETKLYANQDLYIYPYRDGIIYKDGELISKAPLEDNVETTYCYIKVEESGTIRRFKANQDKSLTVTSNYSTKQVFKNENNKVLEMYQTTFYFDNDHIKSLRCLTTEKKMPMTIGDMNKQMGDLFKFEFPEIVDI